MSYDILAPLDEFLAWMNDDESPRMHEWVRWNGNRVNINKDTVQSVRQKES
jgi:hypothetical protein